MKLRDSEAKGTFAISALVLVKSYKFIFGVVLLYFYPNANLAAFVKLLGGS